MLRISVLFLCALFFMACSNGNTANSARNMNNDVDQARFEVFQLSYQAKGIDCNTGPRIATKREQLCRNLQINIQNNNCAELKRRELFARRCPSKVWQVADAQAFLIANSNIKCDVLEDDTLISSQYFTDNQIVLVSNKFFALISKDNTTLQIKVMNRYPNGDVLTEKTFSDIKEPAELAVEGKGKVICRSQVVN